MTDASQVTRKRIAAAVVVRNSHVLLTRRHDSEGAIRWAFPGGEIEQDESPEAAAVREVAEELALHVLPYSLIAERVHPATQREMVYVGCVPQDSTAEPTLLDTHDLAEWRWASFEEADTLTNGTIYEPVRQFLTQVLGEG